VPQRLVIAVLLAAVLLAASTLAGCSTATGLRSDRPRRPQPPPRPSSPPNCPHRPRQRPVLSPTRAFRPPEPRVPGPPGTCFPCPAAGPPTATAIPTIPPPTSSPIAAAGSLPRPRARSTRSAGVDRWDPTSDRGADRGGLSVSVIGMDGVRYYGSHLQSIAPGIVPGARVLAGQLLGRIDNSGDARTTPTHVHFGLSWPTPAGIWWIRRGLVYAWPYLDAWRAGRNLSPAPAIRAAHAAAGSDIPPCRIRC
jgi:peptidoglycan LD-endopeptidase LytH